MSIKKLEDPCDCCGIDECMYKLNVCFACNEECTDRNCYQANNRNVVEYEEPVEEAVETVIFRKMYEEKLKNN